MIATEIRDANWHEIEGRMTDLRGQVYWKMIEIEVPSTTRDIAGEMGRSEPTSIRPRVTELVQLGLARCVGVRDGEGLYEAVSLSEAQRAFEARRAGLAEQRLMNLEA